MPSKFINAVSILCCLALGVFADVEISLSGTVKDSGGAAISGAIISLAAKASMKDTTNDKGEFVIGRLTAIRGNIASAIQINNAIGIGNRGNNLRLFIGSSYIKGSVSIFSSNGKRIVNYLIEKNESGEHLLVLPVFPAGLYVIQIAIDGFIENRQLVNTGSNFFLNNKNVPAPNLSIALLKIGAASVDTLIITKSGFKTLKKAITSYKQSNIAIAMQATPVYAYGAEVENTCADCLIPELTDTSKLTVKHAKLPDPFTKLDGKRITKKSEWRCRRQEIIAQAMKYIYGDKPMTSSDSVTGTVTNTKITVHVEANGKKIDISATVNLPATGKAPYPAIIILGQSSSQITTKASSQGVAIIAYDQYALGKESIGRGNPNQGLFYDIYGGRHSAGLLMAWAWGASRIIDVLQKSGGAIIDYSRLGVTGCSRWGKGAFAIGLFDERVAVVLSEETSVLGVPAYRVADKLCPENTENNFNGENWFSNNFKHFVKPNTEFLPIDAHEIIATFAPRGLYSMENTSNDATAKQMCPQGGNMSIQGGMEVFKTLGCEKNLSYNSKTPTNTGHCSYTDNFTEMLNKNITKFLLHQPAETGGIVPGSGTLDKADWIDWTTPTLEDDTKLYQTE